MTEYGYDNASRVTSLTYKLGMSVLGDLTYEYDKAGNRTKVDGTWARTGIPQAVATTNYDNGNRQLTFGDKTLTYDNNGNLTSIVDGSGTTLYSWNARNQLAGISGPGLSASFAYDGSGRREQKIINGALTQFVYDVVNPVQELSGNVILANILSAPDFDSYLFRSDVPSGITAYYITDALQSVIGLADSAGNIQSEYTYEPFGRGTTAGNLINNEFQFTGRESDIADLYYFRARFYHSVFQRFVSEDPIGLAGNDVNFYVYVNNTPINASDPLGLITPRKNRGYWDACTDVENLICQIKCANRGKKLRSCSQWVSKRFASLALGWISARNPEGLSCNCEEDPGGDCPETQPKTAPNTGSVWDDVNDFMQKAVRGMNKKSAGCCAPQYPIPAFP